MQDFWHSNLYATNYELSVGDICVLMRTLNRRFEFKKRKFEFNKIQAKNIVQCQIMLHVSYNALVFKILQIFVTHVELLKWGKKYTYIYHKNKNKLLLQKRPNLYLKMIIICMFQL